MASWKRSEVEGELPALRRYARVLTRDETTADDLVQEALVHAYERAATFQPGRPLKTWLLSIVHNRFVSGRRQRQAEQRRDAAFAVIQAERIAGPDQEAAVYLRQIAARFEALPDQQRTVLHLVGVEGLSYQEAADALGVAIGTIMSRLSRARAALRDSETPVRGRNSLHIVGGKDGN